MTTLDELAASWDEKAAHWRRTAKQQRSACRGGDSTKVRLLEKAQLAEDCARELREAMAEPAKLFDGGLRGKNPTLVIVDEIQQDTPALKAKANRLIGRVSVDLDAKAQKFGSDIERAATIVDSGSRDSTVVSIEPPEAGPDGWAIGENPYSERCRQGVTGSGAVFTPDIGFATADMSDALRVVSDKPGLEPVAWPIEALRAAAGAVPGELVNVHHDESGKAFIKDPAGDRIYVGQPHPGYPAHKVGDSAG